MEIILIRHGESQGNSINEGNRKVYIGQCDYPLTDVGVLQAEKLAQDDLLKDIDAIYCSDLLRTKQTASLIFNNRNILYTPLLRERSLGIFEGHSVDEIKESPLYKKYFSDSSLINFAHNFNAKAPEGENYSDVCNRVAQFLESISKLEYNRIVVVSHFCTIRCFIKIINNLSQEETLKLKVYPCNPIIINYKNDCE